MVNRSGRITSIGAGNFPENFKVSLKKRNTPLLVKVGACGDSWSMFVGFDAKTEKGRYITAIP